jgi:hypothetical protein
MDMRWVAFVLVSSFVALVACSNDSGSGGLPCCTATVVGTTTCVCNPIPTGSACSIKNASATACILVCKGMMDIQGTPRMTCGDAGDNGYK